MSGVWWRCLILLLLLGPCLAFAEMGELVKQLGHADLRKRNEAEEELQARAEGQPREMMMRLAEHLGRAEDLEVRARLEKLLTGLAREWIFYHPPAFMGINYRMVYLEDDDKAVEVLQVLPGEAAEQAGIQANDRILEFEGVDIGDMENQEAFADAIAALQPGQLVEVVVLRKGREAQIRFPLGVRDLEHMNIPVAAAEEEQKITEWLSGLRGGGDTDSREPMGHFRTAEPLEDGR
jgi:predicted metalloprotease with PDZ domain